MNYLVHATPVHPSLCLQYLILLFTIDTITVFTLLLLLLFYYCHHYKTIATDKPLWASLFPSAAELTTHLLRLINILWLPLCRINKFGFYFPRRLLRSPILVGHQCRRHARLEDGDDAWWLCWYHATLLSRPSRVGDNAFLRGEDDMGTEMKVKPNFRTPPIWGQLVEDWHARTTYNM
jgi:hypothetical protein